MAILSSYTNELFGGKFKIFCPLIKAIIANATQKCPSLPLLRPILSSGSLWVVSRILDFQLPRSFISNNGLCPFFWSSVFLVQDLYTKHMRRRSMWRLLINDCNKMLNFSLQGWKKGMATCNFSRGQLLKTEKISHLWIFRCSNFEKFIPFFKIKVQFDNDQTVSWYLCILSQKYCIVSKLWFVHLQFLSMAATMNLMESENAIKENSILFCIKNLRGLFFSSK